MRLRWLVGAALVLALAMLPLGGQALSGWGCWTCRWDRNGLTGPDESFCEHVPHGGSGDNVLCRDETVFGLNYCDASGGACTYTVVCG